MPVHSVGGCFGKPEAMAARAESSDASLRTRPTFAACGHIGPAIQSAASTGDHRRGAAS
jgi:hypothetical protein